MRTEADVFRAVVECYADRTAGVDELVAECLSRPDSVPPWVVAAAANVATFLEIYRFDFDAARRWQNWAYPYHQQSSGPFSLVYGHCLAGIAANEQLDVAEAERRFREALRVAKRSGDTHSHAARLACALLGELLYERGEVDEADRLLDESYQLGAEGGGVEFMIARYVTGARIKAVRGDRDAAAARLDERRPRRGNYWPSPAARPCRQRADAAGPAGRRIAGAGRAHRSAPRRRTGRDHRPAPR